MSPDTKSLLLGVAGLVIGAIATVYALQQLADATFSKTIELGEISRDISLLKKKVEAQLKLNENSEHRLSEIVGKIDSLSEKATGLSGEDASARLELLSQLSGNLESGTNTERLILLENSLNAIANRTCTTQPVQWGSFDKSCGSNNDQMPKASCPDGKFLRAIDIVPQQQSGRWRCGFQITCC